MRVASRAFSIFFYFNQQQKSLTSSSGLERPCRIAVVSVQNPLKWVVSTPFGPNRLGRGSSVGAVLSLVTDVIIGSGQPLSDCNRVSPEPHQNGSGQPCFTGSCQPGSDLIDLAVAARLGRISLG